MFSDGSSTIEPCVECLMDNSFVITSEYELVCSNCGLMSNAQFEFAAHQDPINIVGPTYKAVFHFNERCAMFTMEDPPIDEDIFELINTEANIVDENENISWEDSNGNVTTSKSQEYVYRYGHPANLDRKGIRKILRSLEEKNPGMKLIKKYAEKWLLIKKNLLQYWEFEDTTGLGLKNTPFGRDGIPDPDVYLIKKLKNDFAHIPYIFYQTQKYRQRHNIPNYNAIFSALLERNGRPEYIRYFPTLKAGPKLKKAREMISTIFRNLFWEVPECLTTDDAILKYSDDYEAKDPVELEKETCKKQFLHSEMMLD